MNQRRVVIELPEDLCAEAIREGLGTRVPASKRGAADAIAMVIGLGGSIISLMQGPDTTRAFCEWLVWRARRDETVLDVRKRPNGEVVVELGPGVDKDAALRFLQSYLEN